MKHGFFITFEGGEGAGKSVQVKLLRGRLLMDGYSVVVTREPGGTRIGEQIRAITHNTENVDLQDKTEAYLMAAARAQHVQEIIEPAIEAGKIVICDRYVDSSIAYQGYGRKLGAEVVDALNKFAINAAIPDLTILLNVSVEIGLSRRKRSLKVTDRLDNEQRDFYDRVIQGYLDLAKLHDNRYVEIDGNKPIEEIAAEIWKTVKGRLDNRNGTK